MEISLKELFLICIMIAIYLFYTNYNYQEQKRGVNALERIADKLEAYD